MNTCILHTKFFDQNVTPYLHLFLFSLLRKIYYMQAFFISIIHGHYIELGLDVWGFATNKSADQPVHMHSLISTFDIRLLESIISKLATIENSLF